MKEISIFKNMPRLMLIALFLCVAAAFVTDDSFAKYNKKHSSTIPLSKQDQVALKLGRKVIAIRKAIKNPQSKESMNSVTILGQDTRHYVMVRDWLFYQLQAHKSILNANKEKTKKEIKERICFLEKAIRALDFE